jgi:hypothetical protein
VRSATPRTIRRFVFDADGKPSLAFMHSLAHEVFHAMSQAIGLGVAEDHITWPPG